MVEIPVVISANAFDALAGSAQAFRHLPALVIADSSTYAAAGQPVETALRQAGCSPRALLLSGEPWVACDEANITRVLVALEGREHLLVALGSGTITDITRFVAFQTRLPYFCAPTAASVDAFTSFTVAITLRQVKQSLRAGPAQGVYAHLPTLCAAPRRLTAAGFGDMMAKFTALADWQLAHLLTGEACDLSVVAQVESAARACAEQADAIGSIQPDGIATLTESLMISGRSMARVGSSRPAAGAEHSLSHFWEINHARRALPVSLHGEKTGVAAVVIARLYANLRALSRQEAAARLARFRALDQAEEMSRLESAFGSLANEILASDSAFWSKYRARFAQAEERLITSWDEVQRIAAQTPDSGQITALLQRAGAPYQPEQIHVAPEEVQEALSSAMYVRDRMTILELNRMLDLSSV